MVLAVALVIAALASPMFVSAKGATVPFKVTCKAYPTPTGGGPGYIVLSIPADCVGTHLGNSEFYSDLTANVVPPFPAPQYGDMVFTAADGSQLFGDYNGLNVPNDFSGFDYWGTYEIVEGTGRFSGTSGSGVYYGSAGTHVGGGTLAYEGTLTNP